LDNVVAEETAMQVRLAASELISNVVRHGNLSVTDTMSVSGSAGDKYVRMEVEQPTTIAELPRPGEDRGNDRRFGLKIVDELSSQWGAERGPPGRVWFEVERFPAI
jgi:two-component sensor histidine kinase